MIFIVERPYRIDFAGNKPHFVLRTSSSKVAIKFTVKRKIDVRGFYIGSQTDEEEFDTETFILDAIDGLVRVDLSLLNSCFNPMDVQSLSEILASNPSPVAYSTINYYMWFAEFSNTYSFQRHTDTLTLINGKLAPHKFISNSHDWKSSLINHNLSEHNDIIILGFDERESVRMNEDSQRYVYVANFTRSAKTRYAVIDIHTTQPDVTTHIEKNIVFKSMSVSRIPMGIKSVQDPSIDTSRVFGYSFAIRGTSDNNYYTCDVEIVGKPKFSRSLLLQNRYGNAQVFEIESVSMDTETEGSETVFGGFQSVDITRTSSTFIANTGFKSKCEMRLLSDAMHRNCNYIVEGDFAYRINILPDSMTVFDEEEDLQSASFSLTIGKPIALFANTIHENDVMDDDMLIIDNILFIQ